MLLWNWRCNKCNWSKSSNDNYTQCPVCHSEVTWTSREDDMRHAYESTIRNLQEEVRGGKTAMEMLLKLLINGGRIEDPDNHGFVFGMSEDGDLCWLDDNGIAHGMNATLTAFKALADRIGKQELWLRLCAMTLN